MRRIDMSNEDLVIYVDGQKVLRIGEVSDDKVINLFLQPEGRIMYPTDITNCTYELIVSRKKVKGEKSLEEMKE